MFKLYRLVSLLLIVSCTQKAELDEILYKQAAGIVCVGIGFDGVQTELSHKDVSLLQDLQPGGVILMNKWNLPFLKNWPKNLPLFMESMHNAAKRPMLYAVDQEGGRVSRMSYKKGYPYVMFPKDIGSLNNRDTTEYYATILAELTSNNGFNFNFAPCVDLNVYPESPVIGKLKRSFSEDPDIVSNIAEIYYDEHRQRGVMTALKHFPGHGSARVDSHNKFTDISDTWTEDELLPYKQLIAKGKCGAIVVGHLYNSNLDSDYPATLSYRTITGLLKDSLGFEGLVVSDDMVMDAIQEYWPKEEYLELAINAGVDMLVFSRGGKGFYKDIVETIVKLVEEGKIPRSRLEEAYDKVLNNIYE